MLIDHNTTIEQYEAWLATGPTLAQFAVTCRRVFAAANRAVCKLAKLLRSAKRERVRSCTAGRLVARTVYPLSYDKNTGYTHASFRKWLRSVKRERRYTTDYLSALAVEDIYDLELRQEETLCEALEILTSNLQ